MPLKQHPTKPDMMIYTKTEYGNISVGKEWVGLTDEEIFGIFGTYIGDPDYNHNKLLLDARRIEAKLKEKNNG